MILISIQTSVTPQSVHSHLVGFEPDIIAYAWDVYHNDCDEEFLVGWAAHRLLSFVAYMR